MEIKEDKEYNDIIYRSVLPCIAQAFSELLANLNEFPQKAKMDVGEKTIESKASQLKKILCDYIDSQCEATKKIL